MRLQIPKALRWEGEEQGRLVLLDQRRLPAERRELVLRSAAEVFEAIRTLAVRGAPAIGVAAAYGLVLGLQPGAAADGPALVEQARAVAERLAQARPTAVNLGWALRRLVATAEREAAAGLGPEQLRRRLLAEARAIEAEDAAMCEAIGRHGAALFPPGARVLTHCNTGALATAGIGTALGAIYTAFARDPALRVFACETRPLLQGARLTAWELAAAGVPVTLIADSMAGALMARGEVDLVIVGADRIARSGDVANKIGTYALAVLAAEHRIPFYVAAPSSTFDLELDSGARIPIEQRDPDELRTLGGVATAPPGIQVWNPAFDVTPARLVRALITERGVIAPPAPERIAAVLAGGAG
ncbi:MAG: methylthioribose-1-phosphate isomerase [Planctomycetota bacterium]|nr:MAG: methylthioribose-1-phosphate isomerase [Planctomycetota bacterium]